MHGLINKAIQSFVCATYGRECWLRFGTRKPKSPPTNCRWKKRSQGAWMLTMAGPPGGTPWSSTLDLRGCSHWACLQVMVASAQTLLVLCGALMGALPILYSLCS